MKIKDLNYVNNRGYIFYEVASERFEENGERKVDEAFRCATYEEAKSEAESMKLDVGYSAVIYAVYLSGVTKEAEEVEFDDIEEIFDENFEDLDIEFDEHIKTELGKNIEGSVIIKWQWNKYTGYSRNLVDIGIAGKYPYNNIVNEIDLITDNEGYCYRNCYSLVMSKEEWQEEGVEGLKQRLFETDKWKWNNWVDVARIGQYFVDNNKPKNLFDIAGEKLVELGFVPMMNGKIVVGRGNKLNVFEVSKKLLELEDYLIQELEASSISFSAVSLDKNNDYMTIEIKVEWN